MHAHEQWRLRGMWHATSGTQAFVCMPVWWWCVRACVQVIVLSKDPNGRGMLLSTKHLEPVPGAMLTDRSLVFERAEEMAAKYITMCT